MTFRLVQAEPWGATLLLCLLWGQNSTPLFAEMGKPELDPSGDTVGFAWGAGYEPEVSSTDLSLLEKIDLVAQSNLEHAASMLEELVSGDVPTSPAFNHALGNVYVRLRKFDEADYQFRFAIRRFRGFRRAWNDLGALRFLRSDYTRAAEALAKCVQLGAMEGHTLGMLGYSYLQMGALSAAETAYNLALISNARNTDWLEGKAQVLIELGKYDDAEAVLRELIVLTPENTQYWLLQANNQLSRGEPLKAARTLEIAGRIGRLDTEAQFLLGNIYLNNDLSDRAAQIYTEALEGGLTLPPDMALKVAHMMLKRSQNDLARRLFAAIENPEDWKARASREEIARYGIMEAEFALSEEDLEGAISTLEGVLAEDPFNGRILYRLAELYVDNGEREKAYILLDRVAEDSPYEYNALILHSRLLVEDGNFEDSARMLQGALARYPGEALADYFNQVQEVVDQRRGR